VSVAEEVVGKIGPGLLVLVGVAKSDTQADAEYLAAKIAGLRIFDIHDPANPKELGYFIPKPADDVKAPLSNDVYQDDRGLLIVTDKWRGMDVIEFTG
jgi:hypothetical protein